MRLGSVILALATVHFLLFPLASAAPTDTTTFADSQPCIAGGVFVLGAGVTIPGCSFSAGGTLHVDACDAVRCLVTIQLHAEGDGLLPGAQSLATTSDDDTNGNGVSTICSTLEPSTSSTLACDATQQVSLDMSSGCRFMVLDTIGAVDVKVAGAELTDSFRVCWDGSAATIEQI